MIYLIDFCGFPWCILPWLLSGFLGFLMGYFWMKKWQSKFVEMEGKYNSLRKENDKLQADLEECKHKRAMLEGDISTANGMVKEMQLKLDNANASLAAAEASSTAASGSANLGNVASGFAAGAATSSIAGGTKEPKKSAGGTSAFGKLKSSNLQIIEGIGPKMESVLHDAKVATWSDLATKSPEQLRGILDSHGDKYKIINPSTWAQQAKLAADGKWDDLILLQKQLDGGNATNIGMTDSKLEKMIGKTMKAGFSKFKDNDLKIVEGVGPKIAELMNNAGINTWAELSNTSVGKLQEILDAAGSRYKLARPGSWPRQAGLAAAGQWEALKKLQDELDGGK